MKRTLAVLFLISASCPAQVFDVSPPPPVAPGLGQGRDTKITVPPPPLIINGKKDKDLTDDERREFLQEKIKTLDQEDIQIETINVAPGYPVTLRFTEPIQDFSVGDKGLVSVQSKGRVAEIAALAPQGDTPVKFLFSGNKIRPYHIFVVDSFLKGDSIISIQPFVYATASQPYKAPSQRDLTAFIKIIANYDALLVNKRLDSRKIRRTPIFKKNPATGFTLYYLYQINGALAYTFAYNNFSETRVRFDESRLRLQVGHGKFIPDYVAFTDPLLDPHATTTGYLIVFNPAFTLNLPVEVIWN